MPISRFWALSKKEPGKPLPDSVHPLQDVTILELAEDGLTFLWPEIPNHSNRCLYCRRFPTCSSEPERLRPVILQATIQSILCAEDDAAALATLDQIPDTLLLSIYERPQTIQTADDTKLADIAKHLHAVKEGRETLEDVRRALGCFPQPNSAYPCCFLADPSAAHQDPDSYILDGEFDYFDGEFISLKDFMCCHRYSESDLQVTFLGTFSGISAARAAWVRKKTEDTPSVFDS